MSFAAMITPVVRVATKQIINPRKLADMNHSLRSPGASRVGRNLQLRRHDTPLDQDQALGFIFLRAEG